MSKRTLVLNSDFTPIEIVDWKSAFVMLLKDNRTNDDGTLGAAFLVESYDTCVYDSAGRTHLIPAVIALKKYIGKHTTKNVFSKQNIFFRDNLTCQYCYNKFEFRHLTVDHVIPKSRWKKMNMAGSPNTFTNVTTACDRCNKIKGDKTPQEAGMKLLTLPRKVTIKEAFLNKIRQYPIPKEWQPFVVGSNEQQKTKDEATTVKLFT